MAKTILIFYVTNLSGHYKAAKALEKSLKILDKDCQILSFDTLKFLHPYSSRIINFLYSLVIRKLPFIWGGIYDKNVVLKGFNPIKKFVHFCDLRKVASLIRKVKPQAVVCTQAFPCGVVSFYKGNWDGKFKLMGVVTDFWPNGFWFYKEVDYYVGYLDWCKDRFRQTGIEESRLKNLGIPVMPEFAAEYDRAAIASEFNLRAGSPAVLLMGGGSGMGPLKSIASLLDGSRQDFQMIVVCGRNKNLYKWFSGRKFRKPVRIFPYTKEVHKLMSFADIIITKPGGITVTESLSKGLAIIAFRPIPGQEDNNLKFLLREGLALKADSPGQILFLVEDLLKNKEKLEDLKKRGPSYAKPNSSLEIAKLILNSLPDS